MYSIETVNPGGLSVALNQIQCGNALDPDYGDSLQVLLFTASDACDPSTYTELDCAEAACGFGGMALSTTASAAGLTYYVIVSGQMGDLFAANCGYNIQIEGTAVENNFEPQPYYIISQGESVIIGQEGADEYLWTPSNSLSSDTVASPEASPQNSTEYTLEYTIGSCTNNYQVFVEVIPGIQPVNLFTPNGDDINDTWKIFAIDQFPNVDVRVYSRWGQLVFRSTGYGEGREWTGKKNGSPLPSGSYYYVIDLNIPGIESDPVTGSVAILY